LGCSGDDDREAKAPISYAPKDETPAPTSDTTGKVGPFEKEFDGITFSIPTGWREVALSPQQMGFVDARFTVPADKEELQLTCSSIGGGIDANVERWIGQFVMPPNEKPLIESVKVGNVDAKWVELHGKFNPGMMSREGPKEDWRMIGIGIGIPMGEHDFYLKLTGPNAAVSGVRDAFRTFVQSGRIKKSS